MEDIDPERPIMSARRARSGIDDIHVPNKLALAGANARVREYSIAAPGGSRICEDVRPNGAGVHEEPGCVTIEIGANGKERRVARSEPRIRT